MANESNKNGITSQQLLDGLNGIANGLDETSDALRDYKRAVNQTRAVVAQVIHANTVATAKIAELQKALDEANKDRAAKAVEITNLTAALAEANKLLSADRDELAAFVSEAAKPAPVETAK